MTERRNPFEGVTDLFSELARVRSTGVHGAVGDHTLAPSERTHASAWVPATDILARGQDLVIRIELAGVDPEHVELSFSHGVLTVSGARPQDASEDGVEFLVRERFYGAFRRTITLPEGTEPDQITADFDDGLVEVTVRGGVSATDSTRIALTDRSSGKTSRAVRRG